MNKYQQQVSIQSEDMCMRPTHTYTSPAVQSVDIYDTPNNNELIAYNEVRMEDQFHGDVIYEDEKDIDEKDYDEKDLDEKDLDEKDLDEKDFDEKDLDEKDLLNFIEKHYYEKAYVDYDDLTKNKEDYDWFMPDDKEELQNRAGVFKKCKSLLKYAAVIYGVVFMIGYFAMYIN